MKKYIAVFILLCPFYFISGKEVYVKEPEPCEISAEQCIKKYFGEEAKIAIAIAYAESNMDPHAENYNCKYGDRYKSCKKEDVHKAVSKDAGIMQVNNIHAGKRNLLDLETNIKVAKEVYDKQGFRAWVTYRNKKYLDYLQ